MQSYSVTEGFVRREHLQVLAWVRWLVDMMEDGLTCHEVCRRLAEADARQAAPAGLRHVRGKFNHWDHSWLEVLGTPPDYRPLPVGVCQRPAAARAGDGQSLDDAVQRGRLRRARMRFAMSRSPLDLRSLPAPAGSLLVPLEPTRRRRHNSVLWRCRCVCGRVVLVPADAWRGGQKRHCGCRKGKGILPRRKGERERLAERRRAEALALRAEGLSARQIGERLGVSRQRAHQMLQE